MRASIATVPFCAIMYVNDICTIIELRLRLSAVVLPLLLIGIVAILTMS